MNENILHIKEKVIENLKDFSPIFIYIFGSIINAYFRDESDIDIAFYTEKEINSYDLFLKAQEISLSLGREIDLINLKNTSTVFAIQVITKGILISCIDNNKRMEFEMYTFSNYAKLNEERKEILDQFYNRGKNG